MGEEIKVPEKKDEKKSEKIKTTITKFTPMKLYLYILSILLTVKFIFDFHGFGDFLTKFSGFIISLLGYLIVGVIIAYVLNAYMGIWENKILKRIKSHKTKKVLSIIIAYLSLILIVSLIVFALVPTLTTTIKTFAGNLPNAFNKIIETYNDIIEGGRFNLPESIRDSISSNINQLQSIAMKIFSTENITKFATGFFTSTVSGIFNIIMGLMVSVYMLIEKEKVLITMRRINYAIFSRKHADTIQWGATQINKILRQYFTGKLLQAAIILIVSYIAFLIAGIKYAILLAVIMAIFNMIPYIGPWMGGAIVVFFSIPQGWISVAASLACILAVQALDNWFVTPKVVGGQMGVSPLLVLIGLCVFGGLFGVPGMIMGDVMAAIFKTFFYDRVIKNRLNKKIKNGLLPEDFDGSESLNECNTFAEIKEIDDKTGNNLQ